VIKHIASNWTRILLQIAVMFVLTPLMVERLGRDGYGIWSTVVAATLVLDQLALGVPLASVRHISEALAAGDRDGVNRRIATGFGVTLGLSLAGLALGLASFPAFEQGLLESDRWADTPEELVRAARVAYIVTAFRVAAGLALRFPSAVFESHRDFITANAITVGGILFRTGAVAAILLTRPSLVGIAWVFVVESLLVFLAYRVLIPRRFPGIRLGVAAFDRSIARSILAFGIFGAVLNVGSMIAYQLDGVVIARMLGPELVTDFEMGNKFFLQLLGLMYGIGAVVMPEATRLRGQGAENALEHVFLKWSKLTLAITLPVCLYLGVLGPDFLRAWLGDSYREAMGRVTRVLAPSFALYLPLRAVALPILLGTRRPARLAAVYLALAVSNLVLSVTLVRMGYGLVGVALGTALPQLVFGGYLLLVTCSELRTSPGEWLRYVVPRSLVGLAPCAALLVWADHALELEGFPQLIAAGVVMLALFAAVWVLYVYRDDRFLDLRGRIVALLGRGVSPS
jgi:O-antigen/teichoic acid export membrane protein